MSNLITWTHKPTKAMYQWNRNHNTGLLHKKINLNISYEWLRLLSEAEKKWPPFVKYVLLNKNLWLSVKYFSLGLFEKKPALIQVLA